MNKIQSKYEQLLIEYGHQGWWPLLDLHNSNGVNPTKTGSIKGYHPGDYSYPKTDSQRFEICVGAILTQNTNWPSVEKALLNLREKKILSPNKILAVSDSQLGEMIRPAGYYNQKAKKLKLFSEFYIGLCGKVPSREMLLALWGIGPETADSILLYAYSVPTFVVDTYTKRIFGMQDMKYDEIKQKFEKSLPADHKLFQEYHALIVEHAKHVAKR